MNLAPIGVLATHISIVRVPNTCGHDVRAHVVDEVTSTEDRSALIYKDSSPFWVRSKKTGIKRMVNSEPKNFTVGRVC